MSNAFDRLPRPRFGLRRPDKMRDIEFTMAELLHCSRILNPFDWLRIPYLCTKLDIDDRRRQRQEEERGEDVVERAQRRVFGRLRDDPRVATAVALRNGDAHDVPGTF